MVKAIYIPKQTIVLRKYAHAQNMVGREKERETISTNWVVEGAS